MLTDPLSPTEVLVLRGRSPIRPLVPYQFWFTIRIKPDANMKAQFRCEYHDDGVTTGEGADGLRASRD